MFGILALVLPPMIRNYYLNLFQHVYPWNGTRTIFITQFCEANQAQLNYISQEQGACFRISCQRVTA